MRYAEDYLVGLGLRQNVAMFDKILRGTLDSTQIVVLAHEVHFVKCYNRCYNLARDACLIALV